MLERFLYPVRASGLAGFRRLHRSLNGSHIPESRIARFHSGVKWSLACEVVARVCTWACWVLSWALMTEQALVRPEAPSEVLGALDRLDLSRVGDARDVVLPPDVEAAVSRVPTAREFRGRGYPATKGGGAHTRESTRRLVVAYATGASDRIAAKFAGISRRVIYDWRQAADDAVRAMEDAGIADPDEACSEGVVSARECDYVWLFRAIDLSKAYCQLDAVQAWRRGFEDDWRAAAEYLARVNPAEFGHKQQVDHRHQHAVVLLPPVERLEETREMEQLHDSDDLSSLLPGSSDEPPE